MSNEDKNLPGVSVHMGFPNPATDRQAATLDLQQLLVSRTMSTFFMRIDGNEWEDKGIFSGDIVIVDRSLSPRKSDLLTWWETDTFYIGHFSQMPADCSQWGVVTSVIHRFRS
jgi:DNA polymerase V